MKIIITKPVIVFLGGPGKIGTLPEGEYSVELAIPIDSNLTWYRIIGTKKTIGINLQNIPKDISFKE